MRSIAWGLFSSKASTSNWVAKHKIVRLGLVVWRLHVYPEASFRFTSDTRLSFGHGYSLTVQRAVGSALAEGAAAKDAAIAIAAIARPRILMRFTGGSPFHLRRGAMSRFSHGSFAWPVAPLDRSQLSTTTRAFTQEIFRKKYDYDGVVDAHL